MKELSLIHKAVFSGDKQAPLLFLVHGRAGNVDVMWTFKSYFPKDWNIISMQAPLEDPVGGYSWWHVHNGVSYESIIEGVAKLKSFIPEAIEAYDLKPKKILAAGFSQGAASLSVVIQEQPGLFAGVGLLAGFVVRLKDQDLNPNHGVVLPKVFMANGTKDEVVSIEKAYEGKSYLESVNYTVDLVTDDVGHKVGTTGMRALRDFLSSFDYIP